MNLNVWGRIFGRKGFSAPVIKCPFCGGDKIDSDGGYVYPVLTCACGSLGAGTQPADLDEAGDQLLAMLNIDARVSEPCIATGHPMITMQHYDVQKIQQRMAEILNLHGYDFRIGPGQGPKERIFWVKKGGEGIAAVNSIGLIPGCLSLEVHRHAVPAGATSIPCWTYVSHGLMRHGQAEIVFTLVRKPDETSIPQEPIRFFRLVDELAASGRMVREGGFTEFHTGRFLGGHVAYIATGDLPDIRLPSSVIYAILITDDEMATQKEFGFTRVMARLAMAGKCFPCPFWSDPERTGTSYTETREASFLTKMPHHITFKEAFVYQEKGKVFLVLPEEFREDFAQALARVPANTTVVMLTGFDPEADACMVWEPGQIGPAAVKREGTPVNRICGCFLALLPGVDMDGVLGFEDGFGAHFTAETWEKFRQAVIKGDRIEIPAASKRMPLVLNWRDVQLQNPVAKKRAGWEIYP